MIVVTECQGDHRRLSIKTHISTNRDAPFYRILQGATEVARVDTNVIYGTFGSTTISSRSQTDSFCLPEGDYALEFGNNYHIDWTPGSYVTLFSTLPDGSSFPIGTYSGMRLGSSIPFSLRFVMSGETAGWTYLADGHRARELVRYGLRQRVERHPRDAALRVAVRVGSSAAR